MARAIGGLGGREDAGLGDDGVDAGVVWEGGEGRGGELAVEADADTTRGVGERCEEAVVEASAAAEAVAEVVEGERGEEDEVDQCGIDGRAGGYGFADAEAAGDEAVGPIGKESGDELFSGPIKAGEA